MNKRKVIIVGDAIVDRYIYCCTMANKTECNASVLHEEYCSDRLGGAANVAVHLYPQVDKMSFVMLLGNDSYGHWAKNEMSTKLPNAKIVVISSKKAPTVVKTRVVLQPSTQWVRFDCEQPNLISQSEVRAVVSAAQAELKKDDVLLISDYEKGCLSVPACQQLIKYANTIGCIVIVDGKSKDLTKYKGSFLVKPNRFELRAMTGLPTDNLDDIIFAAKKLHHDIQCSWVLVTMDKDGMALVGEDYVQHIPAEINSVMEAVGAGDAVIATIAAEVVNEIPVERAWMKANRFVGTLFKQIELPVLNGIPQKREDKIVTLSQLSAYLKANRAKWTVVFTNGCFDIIHPGHVFCLEQAATYGDILIVGVNDDESVRYNKGDGRPVNTLSDRATVLSALSCVSFVVPFSEHTPINIIKTIRPDVLVKGGDYAEKAIVGAEFVRSYGGKVVTTGYDDRHSTSKIIKSIGGVDE